MKKRIAIYGAGGLGREIAWMLKDISQQGGEWEAIGFYDDAKVKDSIVDGLPVLGGFSQLNVSGMKGSVVIAISDPATKKKVVSQITNPGIDFPVIIHPQCNPGDISVNSFGKGTVLTAGVILTTHIQLGEFVLVNLASTIGHDVKIGNYSTIMPGCSISGNVSLGERCMMGTGARTLQNISIGAESIIGAGAVVTKNFGEKVKLIGVPAVDTSTHG